MLIVKMIYSDIFSFPKEEVFGLKSQIQRSAVSIPSNIAEGSSRNSDKEFSRFLEIALGSAFELETQLIISNDLNYIGYENYSKVLSVLTKNQKQINTFITKLKS